MARGGPQAKGAALMCQNPEFCRYLDARFRWEKGFTTEQLPDGTCNAEDAAHFIRERCGIESRADLDHDIHADYMFRRIRADFQRWQARKRRAGEC